MKKFFALFLMFCVLLNSVVLASADEHIWSNASEWAVDELKNAEIAGLIPESFNDKDLTESVTREEFAEISVKAYEKIADVEAEVPDVNPFNDTENANILKAYNLEITRGTTNTTFEPQLTISREEAAATKDKSFNTNRGCLWSIKRRYGIS